MASRSYRKRRHLRPYEEWGHPSPMDQLVALVREAHQRTRYPESAYEDLQAPGKDSEEP